MKNKDEEAIISGAAHVDEVEELIAGYSASKDISGTQFAREDDVEQPRLLTELAGVTLTMFTRGHATIVRVGNAHNSSELYEMAFDSPDAANAAMLESGILTVKQVPSPHKVAGLDLPLNGITVEQLEDAGFKRQNASTL